ncbi:MAG: exodeoxyribonuclease VII large subunit, partial [Candidatus Binatia bacterium]
MRRGQGSLLFPPSAPAAAEPRTPPVLTVSELAAKIQTALDRGLDGLWVVGEVSNFRPAPSGHCYFTLKDDRSQISAVLFRSDAARLRFR